MSAGPEREGWGAPLRLPLIATAATLALLLGAVIAGAWLYDARLREATHAALPSLPAPRLETVQRPPRQDRPDYRQAPPPRIGAALRATAAAGDAVWAEPQ